MIYGKQKGKPIQYNNRMSKKKSIFSVWANASSILLWCFNFWKKSHDSANPMKRYACGGKKL